jgi:hypothetical protein
MERWVGSVRRECLDRLLILRRRQLEHVLRVYVKHYNGGRPHRALDLKPPDSRIRSPIATVVTPHVLQVNGVLVNHDPLAGIVAHLPKLVLELSVGERAVEGLATDCLDPDVCHETRD